MRIGMWMGAPLRALGMVAVMALAACGGGGGDDKPALEVTVKVDGVADSAGPLSVGETSTIAVPSGATLVFDSPGETRWEPTATDSTFAVNSFSFTSKSMTVSSNAGGTLVVVFTDKADASQKATLNVTVAPKEFERVARVDGEVETWSETAVDAGGSTYEGSFLYRSTLMGDAGYGIDVGNPDTGSYGSRLLYDGEDRYLGYIVPATGKGCTYDNPIVQVSYPMHVGKTWSGSAHRDCPANPLANFDQTYVRTVEAYVRVTVPEGTHDALRVRSDVSYTNFPDSPNFSYTMTSTCWWAVDLGRSIKCEYVSHYPDNQTGTDTVTLIKLTR